jgi:hypothetical protein
MKMPANPAVGNWRNNDPEMLDLPNRWHFLKSAFALQPV